MLDLLPRYACVYRMLGTKTMASYPALNKALVIDPSGELRDFLRFCAGRFWPGLQIVGHLWARGCPDESFDWSGYDLVVMEHRLHNSNDRGITWLRAIRRNPAAPPVVLVSGELTESLRTEAERVGAAAALSKNDLSPNQFAGCLERVLGASRPDSQSMPTDVAASGSWPMGSMEAGALQIPGYRILRRITTTDRGWVSLARDDTTGQTVALKTVRVTEDLEAGVLQSFRREYSILSTLGNVNVVRVLEQGAVDNCVFVVMEYCPGGDLGERIVRGISTQDAVLYLTQIMHGLLAIHAHGIVHRSLEPTHLLFREHGALVLSGFAMERDVFDNPNYVSPESIRGATKDLRGDLYSAGAVFYHMLTGAPPFKSATASLMLEAHLEAAIPRLPRKTAALQPLIDGLLQKNPNDRFQSAAEVLDGLEWLAAASA
jgi:eukaryotic-like serine/threonine-protein kinase